MWEQVSLGAQQPLPLAPLPSRDVGASVTGFAAATRAPPPQQPALRAGHVADAYITLVSQPGGAFTFACKASRKPCPGGVLALNGTGQLSRAGNEFTLTPSPGSGLGPIAGVVNDTFGCRVLALLTGLPAPVQWQYYGPPPATPLNTEVTVASYVSGVAVGTFASTGVAILSPSLLLLAGNGPAAFPGITPALLLSASADSNGTLLLLRLPAAPGAPTSVAAVIKVGGRVDHARASTSGNVVVAGSFGVAVVRDVESVPSVAWHDPLQDVTPGSCGTCCSNGGAVTCRVDIGDDGIVAVALAAATQSGEWLWAAWDATGVRMLARAERAAALTSVYVHSATQTVGASWFYNDNTGHEPMVMPAAAAFTYATLPPQLHFRAFPWGARTYRSPGPCDGHVADGRIMALRAGRNGSLLVAGRSDGGDSPFACGLRNASRVVPYAQVDDYTNPSNMQSQAITQLLRLDPAAGEVALAQTQVARLPTGPRRGNTLLTLGAHSDGAGTLYLLQDAACCIPNMPNLTINGMPLNGWSDAAVLQVLDASMARRLAWTHFARPGSVGASAAVDIDVRGGLVALTMLASSDNVLVSAITGTGPHPAGVPVAYLVVLPTAEGQVGWGVCG